MPASNSKILHYIPVKRHCLLRSANEDRKRAGLERINYDEHVVDMGIGDYGDEQNDNKEKIKPDPVPK